MSELILFWSGIGCACFCYDIAKQKNQGGIGWFFLGAVFNVIALIAIAGMPSKKEVE